MLKGSQQRSQSEQTENGSTGTSESEGLQLIHNGRNIEVDANKLRRYVHGQHIRCKNARAVTISIYENRSYFFCIFIVRC